jgi:UrcA family protein
MAKYRFPALIAATAFTMIAAPSVSAAERHQYVEYSDLDLSTQQGQDKFKSRIMRAVRNVCAFPQAKSAADRLDQQQCEARAKTVAMNKAAKTIARHGGNVKVALD